MIKNKIKRYRQLLLLFLTMLLIIIAGTGCAAEDSGITEDIVFSSQDGNSEEEVIESFNDITFHYEDIPPYEGEPYVEVNGNVPYFTKKEIVSESFEKYGELDHLGRCTESIACLSIDTMPSTNDERGPIGNIKPSGWFSKKYDCVEGKFVMNRCHCIGWQLSNENDNIQNLISGSRYLNLDLLYYNIFETKRKSKRN